MKDQIVELAFGSGLTVRFQRIHVASMAGAVALRESTQATSIYVNWLKVA